jgi:hypothetical protein
MHIFIAISSYTNARLLEINAHSLFSKWFSESGKLVQRLFSSITELVDEEDGFVVVLIGQCLILLSLVPGTSQYRIYLPLPPSRRGGIAHSSPRRGNGWHGTFRRSTGMYNTFYFVHVSSEDFL